jgi:D-ribose pyranase
LKKTALLNAPLSNVIASMGHTDGLCIADAGLPIPFGSDAPERIDLALTSGTPSFTDTFVAVLTELVVERAIVAEEIRDGNPQILKEIRDNLGEVPIEFVSHEEFKVLSRDSRAIVRTGECTPYANILLYSGVPF